MSPLPEIKNLQARLLEPQAEIVELKKDAASTATKLSLVSAYDRNDRSDRCDRCDHMETRLYNSCCKRQTNQGGHTREAVNQARMLQPKK